MKRRSFLAGGMAVAGLGITVSFSACSVIPAIPRRPMPDANAAKGWVHYQDGAYRLILPRVDIGQNITTALKQIACDELEISWEGLNVIPHTTREVAHVKSTVGSESVKDFAVPLAQACATLREAVARGVPDGEIAVVERPISQLRSFSAKARYVGQKVPLEQIDEIVRGRAVFTADVRREGMVYGRVLRAPVSPELKSQPLRWDRAAAARVPGFIAVVEDRALTQAHSRGLGILAKTPAALDRIEAALDVGWQIEGSFEQGDVDRMIDVDRRLGAGGLAYQIHGDEMPQNADWDVDLRLDLPLAAHAPIEPRSAFADMSANGRLTIWAGTQDAFFVRDTIAKAMGLSAKEVDVRTQRVGGAFGGKTICTVEQEAAVLARAAKRPVKVQWTRAQEFRFGFHRPPTSQRLRVSLNEGRIDKWWHAFAGSHILFTNAAMPQWMQSVTDLIGDPGVARGADHPYRTGAKRVEYDLARLPVFTGPWRGLGAGPNNLAVESAIDECARKAGRDPVAFRLEHLDDPRLKAVLNRIADNARWGEAAGAGPARRGRGVACGIYKEMSYAAAIADVTVMDDGAVRVTHLWCAHDCGKIINPDQVRAQCEGNLVWGLGMVLSDRLPVEASAPAAQSFADAPIPFFDEVPEMTIELINSEAPPTGAAETAIVAAAGAIANAVRDATGVRPAQFPLTAQEFSLSRA